MQASERQAEKPGHCRSQRFARHLRDHPAHGLNQSPAGPRRRSVVHLASASVRVLVSRPPDDDDVDPGPASGGGRGITCGADDDDVDPRVGRPNVRAVASAREGERRNGRQDECDGDVLQLQGATLPWSDGRDHAGVVVPAFAAGVRERIPVRRLPRADL